MIYAATYPSPLGEILLTATQDALIGLALEGQRGYLPGAEELIWSQRPAILTQTMDWLERYFRGERPEIGELCLALEGSLFRREVWELLCQIPYGQVTTYGALAGQLAARHGLGKMSAQAVGNAVGHNPISIIIPCHRVVGVSGSLTGYDGGLEKKTWLLTHEGVDMRRFFMPKKRTER